MPQDWFSANAPKAPAPSAPAGDWFASNAPSAKPAGTAPSWLDSIGTFLGEGFDWANPKSINRAVQAANPLLMAGDKNFLDKARDEGVLAAVGDYRPVHAVRGILDAQGKLAADAQKDFEAGNYGAGVIKALHYLVPVIGPQLQNAGEDLQSGEYARGLGKTLNIAGQMVGPKVLGDVAGVVNRAGGVPALPKLNGLTPAEAEAVSFARERGVPVDAATATGNGFVKGAGMMAENGTLAGSAVAGRARAAQASKLATLGDQLAAKGYPAALTKEAAGESLRDTVAGVAKGHGADADYAYQTLRAYEADPANAKSFTIARNGTDAVTGDALEAPSNFAPRGAPKAALFDAVYADARKQGWKGTKQDLQHLFDERVRQAQDLGSDMASVGSEHSSEALLSAIRKIGLRPSLREGAQSATARNTLVRGDFAKVVDNFRTGPWKQAGGASIFRKSGRPIDEVVQILNQDQRFSDLTVNGLYTWLDDISSAGPSGTKPDLEHLLGAVHVKPGSRWWDAGEAASDAAMVGDIGAALEGKHLVRTQTVPLGVDLRPGKQGLQPLYDDLKQQADLVPLQGAKADALVALNRLMQAPDVAPLSVVDGALGELKSALRKGIRGGEFPNGGQAATSQIANQLEAAVKSAAREAGPEVLDALESGRASTVAKYKALDVLDLLKDEPVQTIKSLTAAKGANIRKLREVAAMAPDEMPKIGRAWLDEQLATAGESGGFAHTDKLYADWQKLDGPTKQLLFRDPGYVKDLDNFFLFAKKWGENPNPSGTAKRIAAGAHMANLGSAALRMDPMSVAAAGAYEATGYAVTKLLHSRRGAQLLTQGLRLKLSPKLATAAAEAKVAAELARFAGPEWYRNPVFADDGEGNQP